MSADASLVQMVQAGGLALFAAAVWYELRQQRSERAQDKLVLQETLIALRSVVSELNTSVAVMLDRVDRRPLGQQKTAPHRRVMLPGEVPVIVDGGKGRPP